MDILTILLRIIHIFSGIMWVGGAWIIVFFIEPSVTALGADGGKFMGHLITVRRYGVIITIAAVLTVLAGWTLWFKNWGLSTLNTGPGIAFALGGVFGLITLAIGGGITGPTSTKLAQLGGEIARAGKPPTREQGAEMQALQARLKMAGQWTAIFASLAVLMMATARYL